MSTITDCETRIKALIDGISGTPVKSSYKYEPKKLGKLPAFTIDFVGFDNEATEVASNTVTYRWILRLYFALHDAEDAADEMKDVVAKVMNALRDDPGLNSNCITSLMERGETLVVLERDRPLIMFEIEFSAIQEED